MNESWLRCWFPKHPPQLEPWEWILKTASSTFFYLLNWPAQLVLHWHSEEIHRTWPYPYHNQSTHPTVPSHKQYIALKADPSVLSPGTCVCMVCAAADGMMGMLLLVQLPLCKGCTSLACLVFVGFLSCVVLLGGSALSGIRGLYSLHLGMYQKCDESAGLDKEMW